MKPEESSIVTVPDFNTFKNISIHRGELTHPLSLPSSGSETRSLTFTLDEQASFIQLFIYGTSYNDYFRYLDSQYHDRWWLIETTFDFLIFDNPVTQLGFYEINWTVNGNLVTLTWTTHIGFSATPPINMSPIRPKFAFVEYVLAERFS